MSNVWNLAQKSVNIAPITAKSIYSKVLDLGLHFSSSDYYDVGQGKAEGRSAIDKLILNPIPVRS